MAKKSWLSMFVEFEEEPKKASAADSSHMNATDIDALLAETRAMTAASSGDDAPPVFEIPLTHSGDGSPPPPVPSSGPPPPFVEARPFADIYAEQGCVPPSPKSVDEVIVFLDGLKTMPDSVQKQALSAMDNADASWTLDDVALDARNKIEALSRAKNGLSETLASAVTAAEAEITAQDAIISSANNTINDNIDSLRAQIVDLEVLRDAENIAAETHNATVRSNLQSTVESCGRESARFQAESTRLGHFIKTFGPNAQ